MVRACFENLCMHVEFESVLLAQSGLSECPQLYRIEEHTAVRRSADEDWNSEASTGREQSRGNAVTLLLFAVVTSETVAEFGSRHLVLELGLAQNGTEETVLIEQHGFVKRHVGDADRPFVPKLCVVTPDGDFVNWAFA